MQEKKKTNALDHAKMAEHSEINKETDLRMTHFARINAATAGDKLRNWIERQELPSYLLEYVRSLLGLGWLYSPLVLGLIRDKGRLLKGQVSLAWESK